MSARSSSARPRPPALAALAVTALFVSIMLMGARGVGERELDCEQAALRLEECCPDFDPTMIGCSYEWSCGGSDRVPVVTSSESDCIRESSCDDLVAAGVCERVLERQAAIDEAYAEWETETVELGEAVCP